MGIRVVCIAAIIVQRLLIAEILTRKPMVLRTLLRLKQHIPTIEEQAVIRESIEDVTIEDYLDGI